MKKILTCSLVLVSVIALLSTCSGTEDIVTPTGAGDTTITDTERMEVFEACKKKSVELNNLEKLEDRIQLLAWLTTQSAFYSSGFAGEDLYAVFKDGRVVMFVNTPLDENIGGRVSSGRSSKSTSSSRVEDLPKSKKVSLFNGLGKLFDPNSAKLKKDLFAEANAGYQVQLKDATIDNLKAVSDDAIFYIHTHGGAGQLHVKNGIQSLMALWTTELVTPQLDLRYKEDLDNENICYMFATHDTKAAEFHYAITSAFVLEYMSFGENCFIYLDACNGMSEIVPGVEAFRERMIKKAKNQKATFVGWTGPTTAYRETGQFVFDRLLGANTGGYISQEDPFQRPFDIASVFADMRNEGLGISPNGAQLTYRTTLEREVILRPTVESIEVDEYTSTLIIEGLFGWDEGHVTVNGVSAVVTAWSPYGIACTINETGDGSVGDVVVVSAEGVKSNAVPLTEYIIKLNYSADDNGIMLGGVATLRLRADVHPRRSKIGETPTKPTYPDYSPSSGNIFNIKGSSAVYTVTGRHYDACNVNTCHFQFTESPTPKVGSLAYALPSEAGQPFFAMFNWGPEMKSIKINIMSILVQDIPFVFEQREQCPNIPEVVIPAEGTYDAYFGFPTYELESSFNIEIADNYNMRPGSWTKSINRATHCSDKGTYKQTVQWEVVVPHYFPTDATPARSGDVGN